jgi:type I restriction enzyme S subunit
MGWAQNEQDDLPPGWNRAPLGLLASVVGGGTPRRDRREFYDSGTIPWATPTDIDQDRILSVTDTNTRINELGLLKSSARLLPAGTVLFSSRASIGKIGIAARPMATNQGVANLIPSAAVDGLYLAYCLKKFTDEIKALASGTTYLEVSKSALREFPIPLPPLREQRRIVAKIEALFEEGRTARQALDRIPPLLKKFRQAVLAAAFRGDLTRDWREQHPGIEPAGRLLETLRKLHSTYATSRRNYNAAAPTEGIHTLQRSDFPDSWELAELAGLCEPYRPITYGILKPGPHKLDGVPYVRVADIRGDKIVVDGVRRTTSLIDHAYRRSRLKTGDVLLSIGGTVGRVCRVPRQLDGANITQDTARISVDLRVSAEWVSMCLKSPVVQKIMGAAIRGVAVRGINIGDVRALQIPLPSSDEQRETVARVEELFGLTDAIEAAVEAARRRADKLEQSILARAFRGELVSQDPDDEPASVALNRICTGKDRVSGEP